MTNFKATITEGVKRPSQFARTANTLRLSHLMEESHRLGIAERIRQLRERSRFTQPELAEKLGLTLRGYQKLEEKGTTKFERAEEIAAIHGVNPDWVWDGREKGATPDLLGHFSGDDRGLSARFDRLEEMLVELRADVADLGVQLEKHRVPAPRSRRAKPASGS